MISLEEYLKDPCGTLSIPYWKAKKIHLPSNMAIVHDREFCEDDWCGYIDETYFRLYHRRKEVHPITLAGYEIVTASEADIDDIVTVINRSYSDIQVDREQIAEYRNTSVFMPELWVLIREITTERLAGCGIAEYDSEAKEVILEWIQVLPEYRRQGIGQAIVMELLHRSEEYGTFATVSGRIDNVTCPEKLYRKCGFTGSDIWHVLRQRRKTISGEKQ